MFLFLFLILLLKKETKETILVFLLKCFFNNFKKFRKIISFQKESIGNAHFHSMFLINHLILIFYFKNQQFFLFIKNFVKKKKKLKKKMKNEFTKIDEMIELLEDILTT